MQTVYIHLVQVAKDCACGPIVMPWIRSPLIRVTVNSLRTEVWEWASTNKRICPASLAQWRGSYPLSMYADLRSRGKRS